MNYSKTSDLMCTHMKNVIFFIVFLTFNLQAQNLENGKWKAFKKTCFDNLIPSQKALFLVTSEYDFFDSNSLLANDSICRVLDATHFIVESTSQNMASYSKIKFTQANNLWKLAGTHSVDKDSLQLFSVKTNNSFLLIENLRSKGLKVVMQHEHIITVKTNLAYVINELLPLEYVNYVSNECQKPVQESIVNDLDLSVNGIFKALQLYPELKGSGQIIGLKDNLPLTNDIDLINKIENSSIVSSESDTHATDMATIISGLGNSGAKGLGVLPEASVFPMDFNNLFPDDAQVINDANVSLINNSYGTIIENYYGVLAEAYDQFLFSNPNKLHVFSSGNSGGLTPDNGVYEGIQGYANLTGNFKMAKNCITVGAHDQNYTILPFSSKGPAYDGRVKPEIVAYSILGTSNAASLVTAAASVIQQAYFENENELPPASLIKAVLLNGADDVGRPGIDFESGYGSLNVKESLDIITNGNYVIDSIASNQTKNFPISVPDNVMDLKVMLVWTDTPALPNDNLALKNDLDITLSLDENIFYPSLLNTDPNLTSLETDATTGIDSINPVEQISISAPVSGNYMLTVNAENLETLDQEFSLVYTWKTINEFEWLYPLAEANFPYIDGETGYVRWKPSFELNKIARLDVSFDNMETWELIANEVDLSTGFYEWELPKSLHTKAYLRFLIDGESEISENFVISTGVKVFTSLNCEDITEIKWNKKDKASQYAIYNLQNEEMALVESTADTTFAFSKAMYPNPYFSIAPILEGDTESLRSETLNTTFFSENCYFDYVFAFLEEEKIALEVAVSSLYNVKSLEGFRVNSDNSLSQIYQVSGLDFFLFNVFDENPIDGENTYVFKITTNDDDEYFSTQTSLRYFSEQNPFLVFPNPTNLDKGITVYSGLTQKDSAFFQLYDLNGRLVLETDIVSDVAFIPINNTSVTAGIYIYKIRGSSANTTLSKKIVIY